MFSQKILKFLLGSLVLSLFMLLSGPNALAQSDAESGRVGVDNPGADLWRAVRQRNSEIAGSTQMKTPDAGVLINVSGQRWQQFRMEEFIPFSMRLLGGVLVLLIIFRLVRGKMKISGGLSGIKIPRFSSFQRFVHWSVATLFVVLTVTGLLLTFGRDGLIPIIGNEIFGSIAFVAKRIHDFVGPVFAIALFLMFFAFIKGNFMKWVDIKWLLKGGGMLGGHVNAGRYNAGEKIWYWIAILVGGVVVGSGLILDFPIFGKGREFMELSHVVHAIASIVIVAVSFGHIYLGTVGVEGALESMKTGSCDANWAKEHHDIWYEEMEKDGKVG